MKQKKENSKWYRLVYILRKVEILKTIALIASVIIISCLSIYIFIIKLSSANDNDYKKLGLRIENYNIEYSTKYDYNKFKRYKVYKIKNYYSDSMEKFKTQLENNRDWSKNKFYEYIMSEFYEIKDGDKIYTDRENLYYYDKNGIYAIFDLKNAKLYYLKNNIFNEHRNYTSVFGIKVNNYQTREIYSVRGGPQNDGLDYYVYEFSKENGDEIVKILEDNRKWSKVRLDDSILNDFKYNDEVLSIRNGYYHYELVCRTSDESKKDNFTKEEATGWHIGVYDVDKNILYYYWESI